MSKGRTTRGCGEILTLKAVMKITAEDADYAENADEEKLEHQAQRSFRITVEPVLLRVIRLIRVIRGNLHPQFRNNHSYRFSFGAGVAFGAAADSRSL